MQLQENVHVVVQDVVLRMHDWRAGDENVLSFGWTELTSFSSQTMQGWCFRSQSVKKHAGGVWQSRVFPCMSLCSSGWSWTRARSLCVLPASQWSVRWFTLRLQSASPLSQSNRHWSLSQARWPAILFSSSKAVCLAFICTWERPWPTHRSHVTAFCRGGLSYPEREPLFDLAQSRAVCTNLPALVRSCLSSPLHSFMPNETVHLQQSVFTVRLRVGYMVWRMFRWCWPSLGCGSVAGSSGVAARVKVHLAPVRIGLQSSEWFVLLLHDALKGISHLTLCFIA